MGRVDPPLARVTLMLLMRPPACMAGWAAETQPMQKWLRPGGQPLRGRPVTPISHQCGARALAAAWADGVINHAICVRARHVLMT